MEKKKRKGRKPKRVPKPNLLQNMYLNIKSKSQLISKLYDKYCVILFAVIPVILLVPAFIIGMIGLFITKDIGNPIVWLCTSYVFIFYLKNSFTMLVDNSMYSNSYKSVLDIIKLIVYFFVVPTLMTAFATVFKDLDSHVLLIIPVVNYMVFKFFSSVTLLYNSYKGLSKKSFWIILISAIICVLLQVAILVSSLLDNPIYDFMFEKSGITRVSIFIFTSLNLFANIIILVLTIFKSKAIKNWREIKIGSKLIRYKHVKGEVQQIYVEGLGRIFFPARKYAKYRDFNDFSLNADWVKFSKKLYKIPEPNDTEMMINNEFLSNPLFRLYYMTLKWDMREARVFKNCYMLFGALLSWRGTDLLQKTGNPIDSHLLIAFGTFLIWAAIFSNFALLSSLKKFGKLYFFLLVATILFHIGHLALYFNVYSKVIAFDIIIFLYFYFSFRFIKRKVQKGNRYEFFNTLNSEIIKI